MTVGIEYVPRPCQSGKQQVTHSCVCAQAATQQRVHNQAVKRFRSTKGASKARRDHINQEIRCLRSLLPIGDQEKQRLSYLHTMALVNIFIRSASYSPGTIDEQGDHLPPICVDFLQAIPGFLVTMTTGGKLVHLSENVREFLGLSMVELVSQGDSFYQMVVAEDQKIVRESLESATAPNSECSFLCRMHCSKSMRLQSEDQRLVLVRGHYVSARASSPLLRPEVIFTALCTPVMRPSQQAEFSHCVNVFHSQHTADLKFTTVSDSVVHLLGYEGDELCGTSWYSLVHPEDLSLSSAQHRHLLSDVDGAGVEMVLRLLHRDSSWVWACTRAQLDRRRHTVEFSHLLISECEAVHLRQKLVPPGLIVSSSDERTSPPSHCNPHGCLQAPSQLRPGGGDSLPNAPALLSFRHPANSQPSPLPCSLEVKQAHAPLDRMSFSEPATMLESFMHGAPLLSGSLFPPGACPTDPKTAGETCACTAQYKPLPHAAAATTGGFDLSCELSAVPGYPDYCRIPACEDHGETPLVPDFVPAPQVSAGAQMTPGYSERERTEINILAEQISCLAESFAAYSSPVEAAGVTEAPPPPEVASEKTDCQQRDSPADPWRNTRPQLLENDFCLGARFVESTGKDRIGEGLDPGSLSPPLPVCATELGLSPVGTGCYLGLQDACAGPFPSPSDWEADFILEELAACESMFEKWEALNPNGELNRELHQLTDNLVRDQQQGGALENSMF